jgi:GNAT superfamily N-acetyltransferase
MTKPLSVSPAHNFEAVEQRFESRLDPSTIHDSAIEVAESQCAAIGITFISAATLSSRQHFDEELYRLDSEVMADEPTVIQGAAIPFEDWVATFLADRDPNGIIVAMHADEMIGLSMIWTESDALLVAGTGVQRKWRGKGIARALKLIGVRYAKQQQLPLRTMNASGNKAIIELNESIGFVRVAGLTNWQRNF